jgi:hypothetical protein
MQSPPKRRLRLTSPHTRGEDVRRLQVALNDRRRARGLSRITVDGEYGPATAAAMRETARALGAAEATIAKGATVGIQRIVRNPKLRTPVQLARAAARKRAAARADRGPDAALRWARSKIGVKEHPADSNTGPLIADWQKAAGMGPGPWCGAFAKASADHGGADVTPEARYTPSIVAHAHARTGGYEGWCSPADRLAKPGDHVLFDWQPGTGADHVGVLESVDRQARTVTCIEGNTSSTTSGSQDNGGMVARRTRSFDVVLGVARVRWP